MKKEVPINKLEKIKFGKYISKKLEQYPNIEICCGKLPKELEEFLNKKNIKIKKGLFGYYFFSKKGD